MSASFHAAMRDSNTSMKLLRSSAVCFAIVFCGRLRVPARSE